MICIHTIVNGVKFVVLFTILLYLGLVVNLLLRAIEIAGDDKSSNFW